MKSVALLMDIEVYKDFFFFGAENLRTNEVYTFEISAQRKNQAKGLYNFLQKFKGYMISFNGIGYDCLVLKYFIKQFPTLFDGADGAEICNDLKWFSDEVINSNKNNIGHLNDTVREYMYAKCGWKDIDLYRYWSQGIRKSKQISLKGLGIQLRHDEIQELPFHPDTLFGNQFDDMDKLIKYNLRNDLGILRKLFNAMEGDIKLRFYIQRQFNLPCLSMDASKIASEYFLDDYCKQTYDKDLGLAYWQYKKEVGRQQYKKPVFKVGDYLPEVSFDLDFFKKIHSEFKESSGKYSKSVLLEHNDTSCVLLPSSGGIHSKNDGQIFESNDEWVIVDADVASLYPTLFKNYKFLRPELRIVLDKYVGVIAERLVAKRNKDKIKDKFLKLLLNSFSGLADLEVSWLYSPQYILALRVTGQLIQLKLIEELVKYKGFKVVFTNTDGTMTLVRRDMLPKYYEIAKSIEKQFDIIWEYTFNKKVVFSNTNSYISYIETEFMLNDDLTFSKYDTVNKVKRKGALFRYGKDIPLGDSTNYEVVPKALEAYFMNGVSPRDFVYNWKDNEITIFDFCGSKKVNRAWAVVHGDEVCQNINRYYFCKKGKYLMKYRKVDKTKRKHHLHKDSPVVLLNNYNPETPFEDYDLDLSFYVRMIQKEIDKIEKTVYQLTLF